MTEKTILMIAYHFPPGRGSSGLQRTLSFCRNLPRRGWKPIVLSVAPRAHAELGHDQLRDIPEAVVVRRSFALDTARHLSLFGRYPGWAALPDRWVSWFLTAVPAGLRLIRRYRPSILWSTYPIPTAHLIGATLARFSSIPWIADFRDPMTETDPVTGEPVPSDARLFRARRRIEEMTFGRCARAVFASPGSLRLHRDRYPEFDPARMAMIPNGYDAALFDQVEQAQTPRTRSAAIQLIHSGVLYPTPDRDPTNLFRALAILSESGRIVPGDVEVTLRASGHDEIYRKTIDECGVAEYVRLEPSIPYRDALTEMLQADGLLVFQGTPSNPAIPAKLYEYLRAQRPIFAAVDSEGDTASVLREAGVGTLASLYSEREIAERLLEFLAKVRDGSAPTLQHADLEKYSREARTAELAEVLNGVG